MAVEKHTAIKVDKVSFSYTGNSSPCINNLSLEVAKGERFGLLGPNAAGKTTLMHLLCGLLIPQQGSVHLLGGNPASGNVLIRKNFGFVPQDFSFYSELSPRENFEFFGAWYGLSRQSINKRVKELLGILGLEDVEKKAVKTFSGGMKRRVNLAIAVLHEPKILFLDEPTVGVDVQTRNAIIAYLKELNSRGTTLFYTSHQLKEAEELCERVALIDEGKIVASGKIDELRSKYVEKDLEGVFLRLTGKEFRD